MGQGPPTAATAAPWVPPPAWWVPTSTPGAATVMEVRGQLAPPPPPVARRAPLGVTEILPEKTTVPEHRLSAPPWRRRPHRERPGPALGSPSTCLHSADQPASALSPRLASPQPASSSAPLPARPQHRRGYSPLRRRDQGSEGTQPHGEAGDGVQTRRSDPFRGHIRLEPTAGLHGERPLGPSKPPGPRGGAGVRSAERTGRGEGGGRRWGHPDAPSAVPARGLGRGVCPAPPRVRGELHSDKTFRNPRGTCFFQNLLPLLGEILQVGNEEK